MRHSPLSLAQERAREIQEHLESEDLSQAMRNELESELGTIADNMSEGCYSNDPDNAVDWDSCPGISGLIGPEDIVDYDENEDQGMTMT